MYFKILVNNVVIKNIKKIFKRFKNNEHKKLSYAVIFIWIISFFVYFGINSDNLIIINIGLFILSLTCLFAVFFIK